MEPHVFVFHHVSQEVEIGKVDAIEPGVGSGDCGVDEQFGCDKVCCGHASVAGVSDPVATNGKVCAMGFVFQMAIVATNAAVGGLFVARHLVLGNEKTGIGTFYVTNSLKEASKFIGEAVLPDGPVFVGLH